MSLPEKLQNFASSHKFLGSKGALSLALILTRIAMEKSFPLLETDFITDKKGQVKGLSGEAVQKILSDHGISRVLAKEGGRTSRGSIGNMQAYLIFLNDLKASDSALDLGQVEKWWIEQIKIYFAASPLRIRLDQSQSIQAAIRSLLAEAVKRQQESTGAMVTGTVIQHLVGAKLEVLYPCEKIAHHGASVADSSSKRTGDFFLNNTVIHVTTAPAEKLLRICEDNLKQGHSPLIITTSKGVISVENQIEGTALQDRIETIEIEQFLVVNLTEWSNFSPSGRRDSLEQLLEAYNRIIEECETDHSLKIEIA
ncbi:DUF4928 family protein [Roseibacillus persicicus]|uniref:DUF4928 family protein n=1 Tax=Roseibacillus persicicus TaxID=454148 RepID=UPI00280F79BF|nr:DUF4928 family protein [Roseibacillus persicicus]MDQ8191158.1 DUF4928 family protein [Roseibacillus persicicus]